MQKGYISEFMNGGRIVAHGQITDLSEGFKLAGGALFSVYARPRNAVGVDTVLSVRCYQDEDFSDAPLVCNYGGIGYATNPFRITRKPTWNVSEAWAGAQSAAYALEVLYDVHRRLSEADGR